MAEVQVKEQSGKGGKVRSKKQPPHVDLTPMVDLAFLLITFFMLVTTFNKPNVMDLGLPAKPKDEKQMPKDIEVKLSNSITIIVGKDNKVFWHQQDQAGLNDTTLNETSFDKDGIRKAIKDAKARAENVENFTVLIKPLPDSKFLNFVDILDEMEITKSERYGITDAKPWEIAVFETKTGTKVGGTEPAAVPAPAQ